MEIVVATGNQKKLKEIQGILKELPVRLLTLNDFPPLPEPAEDGKTFAENAAKKAKYYARKLKKIVLAEDSGLEITALGGKPGVYSARFAGPGKKDSDNIAKVLGLMEGIPKEKRQARFTSAVCLAFPERKVFAFEGKKQGFIGLNPKGEGGFGYDPIFFLPEKKKTFAQMKPEEKNRISHRRQALEQLRDFLTTDTNALNNLM
ncbi:MAG: XTP/dITP diphosphatase [Candidatus Omnitrophota bacterium]